MRGLIVVVTFCYNALGSDLLPAMDEGGFILDYLMPAGSSLADTNEVLLGVEKILANAGSGEHIAPHRAATGPGGGDRSEHGRFHGEAEAQTARRTIDKVIRRSRQRSTTSIRSSMSSSSRCCRTDRRPDQFAGADRDQAVLAGSRVC
jgi:multidrug efflux pump subunit AcrB